MDQYQSVRNINNPLLLKSRDYIAGSIAGITSVLLGQPFDTIKVRLQSAQTQLRATDALKNLVYKEGVMALYKGVSSPLVGATFIESLRFGVFEQTRRMLDNQYCRKHGLQNSNQMSDNARIINTAVGGSIAGQVAVILISPVEHVRIRMQVQEVGNQKYANTQQCFKYIMKNHGIRGLYKGTQTCLLRDAIGNFFYFGGYELTLRALKNKYVNKNNQSREEQQRITQLCQLTAGGASGVFLWLSMYPIDNIKSRIQTDCFINPLYKTFQQSFKILSYSQMFRGFMVCILRSVPNNAGCFFAFETVKSLIDEHTGQVYH